MAELLVKPKGEHGHVTQVTPQSAGWTYVGFDLYRLKAGGADVTVKGKIAEPMAAKGVDLAVAITGD